MSDPLEAAHSDAPMSDPLEAAASTLRDDLPRISDAMKNYVAYLAANDISSMSSEQQQAEKQQAKKPLDMQHLLSCAKVVLSCINAYTPRAPLQWAAENPQGEEETAQVRVDVLTTYKACHLLAVQAQSTAGAKVTKLLGRRYLQASGCWEAARQAAAAALSKQRFPPVVVDTFLSGWSAAISGDDAAAASLVWAKDFAAELEARRAARSAEVRERQLRIESGEDEAARLREAMSAQAAAGELEYGGGEEVDDDERIVDRIVELEE